MPVVKGGDSGHAETFRQRDDRRVGTAKWEVPVHLDQLGDPWQVLPEDWYEGEPVVV